MLHFLDIIMTPGDWEEINSRRPRRAFPDILFNKTDNVDSAKNIIQTAPDSASVDTLINKGVADTISNKNGVIDTLHASGSFLNGPATGDNQTTLIWTALAVIAALVFCFCLIRLYRKRCCAAK
ncbi:MAG: hypothetical protein J6Y51_04010 [Bacteroidaceae bacterium]|nr:hypothetical protein [Bacteroidaceae bacterium]